MSADRSDQDAPPADGIAAPAPAALTETQTATLRAHFDADFYLAENADVRATGMDPLTHYVRFGEAEGRAPRADFHPARYRERHGAAVAGAANLFLHYLTLGREQGLEAEPADSRAARAELIARNFDPEAYLAAYPDVADSGLDPVPHYIEIGEAEGRSPSPDFDPVFYRQQHADLAHAPILIGRGSDAAIRLDDDYVSTRHARIAAAGDQWFVEDLGSTNGTYIGTVRITQPTTITLGTQVRIGKTILELRK